MHLNSETKHVLLQQAEHLCQENGVKLLFLSLFGSHLYGTETPGKSDIDVRGIFMPSMESLALKKAPKSLHFSTCDQLNQNTASDIDIDLWSVQHWLLKLLPAGDTGAIDLLFAPSYPSCIIYFDPVIQAVFNSTQQLLDIKNSLPYAAYSLGQAKKYGIKGSRLGTLKAVINWIEKHCPNPLPGERLEDYLDCLSKDCTDGRFCTLEQAHGHNALQLCGKLHIAKISMVEFVKRITADVQRYGARVDEAGRNRGIDLKAMSHAIRALFQMEELIQTGKISFPLKNRKEILQVKLGKYSWEEIDVKLSTHLKAIEIQREHSTFAGTFNQYFAEKCVLDCYALHMPQDQNQTKTEHPVNFQAGYSIPAPTLKLIQKRLNTAENDYQIKILYACESGSRGWGFASPDSDFDVRFIYVHPEDWYLGLAPEEKRNVIELGIENTKVGELDINGWELRKALKLFRQSNPALLEWLSSPLIYREIGPLTPLLKQAAALSFSPIKIWHHYRSLQEKTYARLKNQSHSSKSWFYILRPLLAMRWIELGKGVVPMRFELLLDGVIKDKELRLKFDMLVEQKKQFGEQKKITPPQLIKKFIESELKRLQKNPPVLAAELEKMNLDNIFKTALRAAWK